MSGARVPKLEDRVYGISGALRGQSREIKELQNEVKGRLKEIKELQKEVANLQSEVTKIYYTLAGSVIAGMVVGELLLWLSRPK